MKFEISHLDHLVLTVADIEVTVAFYQRVLGMQAITFGEGRQALSFGNQKINLHKLGNEFEPKAKRPTAGSADLCLLTDAPQWVIAEHLVQEKVAIEQGPVQRTGATGPLLSLYFSDPDGNLLEVANSLEGLSALEARKRELLTTLWQLDDEGLFERIKQVLREQGVLPESRH